MLHLKNFENKVPIVFLLFACFLFFNNSINSQELPNKIRGYKLYNAKVLVQNESEERRDEDRLRVEMDFAEPELASVGLFGITIEMGSSLTVFRQSGKIDFIAFKDFKVNGIKVRIAEYHESFKFKKGKAFELKKPVKIFVSTRQSLRGAMKEFKDSKDKWIVKGRVFVFGKFRKFGFHFKRVIPVDIELKIDNPLKEKASSK